MPELPSDPSIDAAGLLLQPVRRASPQRRRLALPLLLSLLVHALLLSLTFGGQEFGFPGLAFPWQDRRTEVPDLRVVLMPAPGSGATSSIPPAPLPLPPVLIEQNVATGPALVTFKSPEQHQARQVPAIASKSAPKAKAIPRPKAATRIVPAKAVPEVIVDAAPPPKPFPAVIALEESKEADFVVPPAPMEPVLAVSAAPGDAGGAAKARVAQAVREQQLAEEAARVEAVQQEAERQENVRQVAARQEAVRQEEARTESARQEAERQEKAGQAAAQQELMRQEAARAEAVQQVAERQENARQIAARQELTRQEAARQEAARQEAARAESLQQVAERQENTRQIAARQELARQEASRQEAARQEAARQEAARKEAARQEAARQEAARQEAARQEAARQEAARQEAARQEAARQEAARQEAARKEAARQEAARQEAAQSESDRQENARQAVARQEAMRREDDARRDAARRAMGRQLDEEAARREAAQAARERSPSSSGLRRGRLFGRTDPNAELILYAEAWSRKIYFSMAFEMVREAAKQPHTDPTVMVAIRSDGSVESVTFVRSSGVAAIDEAVRRIIQNQTPYLPFQPALARDFDVIEIRRTWHFDTAIRLY